jgi:hypothetical protein
MGANRDKSGKALRIGGIECLLPVDEYAPIGGEHQIGTGLENKGEVLIQAKIGKQPVADIAEVEHIGSAGAKIRLKGTELGKAVLKQETDAADARAAYEVSASLAAELLFSRGRCRDIL